MKKMHTAIIIGAYLLIIFIDLPYFFKEKNKLKFMAVYFFFVISGVILGIMIGKPEGAINLSEIITNIVNSITGSD